jgi:protein-disulfide isomerase-like protein with CxxC motif
LRVAFDPTEGALKKKFDTVGFPTLVVIDKANSVRYLHRGYNAADTMFRQHLVSALTSPYQ